MICSWVLCDFIYIELISFPVICILFFHSTVEGPVICLAFFCFFPMFGSYKYCCYGHSCLCLLVHISSCVLRHKHRDRIAESQATGMLLFSQGWWSASTNVYPLTAVCQCRSCFTPWQLLVFIFRFNHPCACVVIIYTAQFCILQAIAKTESLTASFRYIFFWWMFIQVFTHTTLLFIQLYFAYEPLSSHRN